MLWRSNSSTDEFKFTLVIFCFSFGEFVAKKTSSERKSRSICYWSLFTIPEKILWWPLWLRQHNFLSVKPTKWSNTVKQADELVCWCFQEGQKMKTLDRSALKIRIYNETFINKHEKHPRRKITFSKVALRVFLTFFKLYKWYQIAWYHKYFRGTTKISISFLIIEAIESTVVAN